MFMLMLTPLGPHARFVDKLLGIRLRCMHMYRGVHALQTGFMLKKMLMLMYKM